MVRHTVGQGGHEHSDVSISLLVRYVVILAVGSLILLAALGLYWKFLRAEESEPTSVSRWAGPREFPPSPRLQVAPEADLQSYLGQQRRQLQTYGWLDPKSGLVRVPIDRAIDMLAQRGLPSRPQQDAPGAARRANAPNAR